MDKVYYLMKRMLLGFAILIIAEAAMGQTHLPETVYKNGLDEKAHPGTSFQTTDTLAVADTVFNIPVYYTGQNQLVKYAVGFYRPGQASGTILNTRDEKVTNSAPSDQNKQTI
jgi:hypothetical protein